VCVNRRGGVTREWYVGKQVLWLYTSHTLALSPLFPHMLETFPGSRTEGQWVSSHNTIHTQDSILRWTNTYHCEEGEKEGGGGRAPQPLQVPRQDLDWPVATYLTWDLSSLKSLVSRIYGQLVAN
jgi:hypothetical protein